MAEPTVSEALRSVVNIVYVLVALCAILALLAIAPLGIALLVGRTKFGPGHIIYFGVWTFSFGAPAALYMFVITHLRRRKQWAAVMGIVVAATHAVAGLLVIGLTAWAIRTVGPTLLIPATAALVLIVPAILLIFRISRLFNHLHELDANETAGFSPIMAATSADVERS